MDILIQYFILIVIQLFLIAQKNIQNEHALQVFQESLERCKIELLYMKIQDIELSGKLYYLENDEK
jgi:hypothetical protein